MFKNPYKAPNVATIDQPDPRRMTFTFINAGVLGVISGLILSLHLIVIWKTSIDWGSLAIMLILSIFSLPYSFMILRRKFHRNMRKFDEMMETSPPS